VGELVISDSYDPSAVAAIRYYNSADLIPQISAGETRNILGLSNGIGRFLFQLDFAGTCLVRAGFGPAPRLPAWWCIAVLQWARWHSWVRDAVPARRPCCY